jgi:acetamidase/formamidase
MVIWNGAQTSVPVRSVGGKMDVRQPSAGNTLHVPVEIVAVLFSVATHTVRRRQGVHHRRRGAAPLATCLSGCAMRRGAHAKRRDIHASVAVELRIRQVVDAPNGTVAAFFPLAVLAG